MTRQDLILYSSEKVIEATIELQTENDELSFYKLFSAYNKNNLDDLATIHISDLFLAYVNARITDKSLEDIIIDGLDMTGVLFTLSETDFLYIINLINLITKHPKKDKLLEAINDSNKRRGKRNLIHIMSADNSPLILNAIEILFDNQYNNDLGIIKILKYYNEYPEIMSDTFDLLIAFRKFESEMTNSTEVINEIIAESNIKVNKKERNKIIKYTKNLAKSDPIVLKITEAIDLINKYYLKINTEETQKIRKYRKQKEYYTNFINDLNTAFDKEEIIDYEKIIKKIPDQEIRVSFLRLVYEHNIVNYQEIDAQYNELANNAMIHYLALLKENGITRDEVNINKIMHNKYDDVVILINELKKISNDKKVIIYGLENSDIDTIKYLVSVINNKLINKKTLTDDKYIKVLSNNSKEFICLQKNISIIKKYAFNPEIFINNPDVVLENENLEEKFEVLQKYNLLKLIKIDKDYSFLNKNLEKLLDMIIELGYINYVIEDINILNENNFERLYVFKAMNIVIEDKETFLRVLKTNNFIISDSKLDDYIPNVVSYYEKDVAISTNISEISELNYYLVNDLYYDINGVILSKNRVLRNYDINNQDKNEALFQAMIKDSVLSSEEIERLKQELTTKKYKK